ncbi:MAG: hypothetical protein DRO67_08465 [Candidatus Asgardarchaeum californiense]|nr:MAG: hypothetical protein DRO67_08465 [Candidatus Asgardarchaeum californiense]
MNVQLLPESLRELFPYQSFRKGQFETILKIYDAIKRRQHIVVEASNGIGKTISVLTAALPVALEKGLKIVYLSRTHTQLERVIDELLTIKRNNEALISAVEIRARRDMCLNRYITSENISAHDAIEICQMLKRNRRCVYFENWRYESVRKTILSYLMGLPLKSRDVLGVGKGKRVCPYEINKSLIQTSTVISAPYIYLVDEKIREVFLSSLGTPLDRIILIFDEAHNLPNIAMDALSHTLSTITVKRAINEAKNYNKSLSEKILKRIERFINDVAVDNVGEKRISQKDLVNSIDSIEDAIFFLEEQGESVKMEKLENNQVPISYIYGVAKFLMAWYDADPEKYVFLSSTKLGKRELIHQIEVVALDPADVIEPLLNCYSTISLSGTIHRSYAEITGLSSYDMTYFVAPEPFSRDQYRVVVASDVTSRLSERNLDTYMLIMNYILIIVKYTPHNVGVFFPSYDVLKEIVNIGIRDKIIDLGKQVFIESPELSSTDNDFMIEEFKRSAESGAVLLGVMGGRNSEGVDYPGKEMESVCVVGIPLAKPTPRVEASIEYYTSKFGSLGKIYSYVIPAVYKASQTAGRVIRSPEDRGFILLLDKRYLWPYYKSLLPQWLRRELEIIRNLDALEVKIKHFYNKG